MHSRLNRPRHAARSMAALEFTCALLLTSCGSDEGDGGAEDEKIAGADGGSEGGGSSSEKKEAPAAEAPSFAFPKDLKLSFADTATGDAGKDEVLRDVEYAAKARVEAYTKGDPATKNMVAYWKHPALQFWGKDDFVAWKAGLVKTDDKHWQVKQTQAAKGATECWP